MPIAFKHAQLSNGMTVIAECDDSAHTSAVGFFVKTGARDEDPSLMGVSHFLEHMMFKGSDKRDAEAVDRDFDNLGAHHNAFTSSEMTAFFTHLLPEHLEAGSEILADIMRPALRDEDFNAERNVILEEIAMYQDHPFWIIYEQSLEKYYAGAPLGHRVLGTNETISTLDRKRMRDYFVNRYSADNTVIAMAGRVDFDLLIDRFEKWCGSWPVTRTVRKYDTVRTAESEFTVKSDRVNRHYGLMIAPGPAIQDHRRYAVGILAQILGDEEGSRLYWALIDPGLADEAQAQYEGRDNVGELYVYYSCSPEDAEEVESIISREIDGLVDSLTEDDLVRVRSKVATAVTLHGERPAGRMRRIGQMWTYTGEYRPLDAELERINAVTLDDLRSAAQAFPFTPRAIGRLQPG